MHLSLRVQSWWIVQTSSWLTDYLSSGNSKARCERIHIFCFNFVVHYYSLSTHVLFLTFEPSPEGAVGSRSAMSSNHWVDTVDHKPCQHESPMCGSGVETFSDLLCRGTSPQNSWIYFIVCFMDKERWGSNQWPSSVGDDHGRGNLYKALQDLSQLCSRSFCALLLITMNILVSSKWCIYYWAPTIIKAIRLSLGLI